MRRVSDILLSSLLLVLLGPFLVLLAVAVRLCSPGPVLYRAERVGRGGKTFRMLKFRTMIEGADRMGPGITAREDHRVTRLGRFLRAAKLDELPQLLNVLKGDMTLIGPRAESPRFVKHFTPSQLRLLSVRPGLTGPGQLHYTTDQQDQIIEPARAEAVYVEELLAEKLERDLAYLDERSLILDLKILVQTAAVVLMAVGSGVIRLGRPSGPVVAGRSERPRPLGKG